MDTCALGRLAMNYRHFGYSRVGAVNTTLSWFRTLACLGYGDSLSSYRTHALVSTSIRRARGCVWWCLYLNVIAGTRGCAGDLSLPSHGIIVPTRNWTVELQLLSRCSAQKGYWSLVKSCQSRIRLRACSCVHQLLLCHFGPHRLASQSD